MEIEVQVRAEQVSHQVVAAGHLHDLPGPGMVWRVSSGVLSNRPPPPGSVALGAVPSRTQGCSVEVDGEALQKGATHSQL